MLSKDFLPRLEEQKWYIKNELDKLQKELDDLCNRKTAITKCIADAKDSLHHIQSLIDPNYEDRL